MDPIIDGLIEGIFGALEARRWTRGAARRIFTIGAKGAGASFHAHEATWLALTSGIKVWWVGPPSLSIELAQLGNDESTNGTCSWLARKPHPKLRVVVQRPGDVLFLGEFVPHATCNLAPTMGVGAQMGFFDTRWLNLRGHASAEWRGASLCGDEAAKMRSQRASHRPRRSRRR